MKRAFSLLLLTAALPGCGIGSSDASPDAGDTRSVVMACFDKEGIPARDVGEHDVVIGDGAGAPRIKFFLTAGESEAAQFQGEGEGAEQIGAAWLYVNDGSDELLKPVEDCLADQ
jgi:hypothetical protein